MNLTYKQLFRMDHIENDAQWDAVATVLTPLLQHDASFNEGRTDEPLYGHEEELCRHLSHLVKEYLILQDGGAQ